MKTGCHEPGIFSLASCLLSYHDTESGEATWAKKMKTAVHCSKEFLRMDVDAKYHGFVSMVIGVITLIWVALGRMR